MYSKLKICSELIDFIAQHTDNSVIASWAFSKYHEYPESDNNNVYDQMVMKNLYTLMFTDEPEFEISRKEMIQMCIDLLNEYLQEINDN